MLKVKIKEPELFTQEITCTESGVCVAFRNKMPGRDHSANSHFCMFIDGANKDVNKGRYFQSSPSLFGQWKPMAFAKMKV